MSVAKTHHPYEARRYRGRFAPTPSGPLHLGSLLTALAGWLQARSQGGQWLIRVDDLDLARCVPGSAEQILRQLETHGLDWDEEPRYQSAHLAEYRAALEQLRASGQVYGCACTRAELTRDSLPGPDGPVYPGTCRSRDPGSRPLAFRLRVPAVLCCLDDAWQGLRCRELESEVGDFVLRRSDGVPGYQLASVVDEAAQGITEVVRGADLLGSSIRQLYLHQALGLPAPDYRHLPLLVNRDGLKLSKQNHAPAIETHRAGANLLRCLALLQQQPPDDLQTASPPTILHWAVANWQPARFFGRLQETLEE